MRIGLFTDTYPPEINGVANSTYILKEALEKLGHEAYVVTTRKGIGFSEWDESHRVLRLSGIELKGLYGYVLTSPFHINAENKVRKLKLDIIHAQTEFGVGIFARICAKTLGIPLVSTYHTTYEDYTHYVNPIHMDIVDDYAKKAIANLSKLYGNSSLAVIAPSQKTKELLERYHIRADIEVIPTGLMLDRFDPMKEDQAKTKTIRDTYHIQEGEKLIIYVGRIASEKSLDLVIDGFGLAKEKGIPCKLLIVGGGPDLENLQDYAKENQLEDCIYFAGPKPSEEVPDYYRASDAFISASLSETQGMTFIEALASGIPLFARKDEVLKDLIVEGKTGWYFEDAKDLAEKLKAFATSIPHAYREHCVQLASPYRSDVFGSRVYHLYEKAIEAYHHYYELKDIKTHKNQVHLSLSQEMGEEIKIKLGMDAYYQLGLKKGVRLSKQKVDHLQALQEKSRAYEGCLRKIAIKDRSKKEMEDWLQSHTYCSETSIQEILEDLESKGYLDDLSYAKHTLNQLKESAYGPNHVRSVLKKKGIAEETIEEVMPEYGLEEEILRQYASSSLNKIHQESVRSTTQKLYQKCIQRGFHSEAVKGVLDELSFEEVEANEGASLEKCAIKAKKRYDRKYSGQQLKQAIFQYCYRKGYPTEAIQAVIEEMELSNDKD
ncbi:MAG: RecX family transcriptional regulator [Solobacterium sp.]|nr:RecX family transcriptional regulator [Solobacterium sp.]